MKHGREDYNRIQDPENKIGKDEPVFLLRAQDRFAIPTIRLWVALVEDEGNPVLASHVRKTVIEPMEAWQEKNGKKHPDMPDTAGNPDCENCPIAALCKDYNPPRPPKLAKPQNRYKCHKEVTAFKIIETQRFPDGTGVLLVELDRDSKANIRVSAGFVEKHSPKAGDYYVVYEDGYKSYSPAAAFEAGYSKI